MITFGTLGPAGSNHDWVARQYLTIQNLDHVELELFADFESAFTGLLEDRLDFVLQVAVHPSVAAGVAKYRNRLHLVDTFLSPSQPMAVASRRDAPNPTTLGLQPATRDYIDVSRWKSFVSEPSTVDVAAGLLSGKYDSGITLVRLIEESPDELRIDEMIGTVVDPWLVFGRRPLKTDGPIVWTEGPAARQYQALTSDNHQKPQSD